MRGRAIFSASPLIFMAMIGACGRASPPGDVPAAASAQVPRPFLIATLVLAALIALAASAGVALARSMGTVVPGCGVDLAETGSTSQERSTLRGRHALCEDAAAGVGTGDLVTAARSGS